MLNILIYDHTQKAQFDFFFVFILLILFVAGIALLRSAKASGVIRIKPGLFTMIRLAVLSNNPRKNRLYGRIAIGFGVLLTFVYVYNFLQIKRPALFADVKQITGIVKQVQEKNVRNAVQFSITIQNETFVIPKDKGYLSNRKPTPGDIAKLSYIIDKNPRLTAAENKRVIRLELEQ